jgi:hypothetical protein
MMNEFMTIEMLATFAGLTAAVALIVQFTKSIVKNNFADGAVRLYTFIVALVLTFIFAKSGAGIEGIVLTVINSILVSIAAMGGYEVVADPKARKEKPEK